ncbi:MAG: hypothetical protein K2J80_03290 [Oscillospiraceae bacterium]|nr:hypothetical protein [Oscillospiraceae bacterium]
MNDKTIRDLYLGKIRPWNSQGFKTEKYKEHIEKFMQLYDRIEAILPSKRRKLLDTMIEEYNNAQGEVIIDAFVKGFQLGMSLTAEGLCFNNE